MDHLHRLAVLGRDRGAQHRLTLRDVAERAIQQGHVQRPAQAVPGRRVVRQDAGIEFLQHPQPFLHQRQRRAALVVATDDLAARRLPTGCAEDFRQPRHRRPVEHRAQRQRCAEIAVEARGQLCGQQRMAAEREEIVVHADVRHAQHLRHRRSHRAFEVVARQDHVRGDACGQVRRRQRLALDLAVGRQRDRIHRDEVLRHHVFGQHRLQVFRQRNRIELRARLRDHIGHQPHVTRTILARDDHDLRNGGMCGQVVLDLAQLDAETAQLHLEVVAAQVFDVAVGTPAPEVAGLVHARAGFAHERIGQEAFGGQFVAVEVAATDLDAADEDLAGHAHRHRLAERVENVDAGVGDRTTDRNAGAGRTGAAVPCGNVDRRFRRAVQVVQFDPRQFLPERLRQRRGQRLAAADHALEARACADIAVFEEGVQHRRHEMHRGDALRPHRVGQVGRILVAVRARHHQPCARQQRQEEFPDRDVEAERRFLQHRIARAEPVFVPHPQQAVDHAAMFVHRALGHAGRTGGVDHIRKVARGQPGGSGIRIGIRLSRPGRFRRIEHDLGHRRVDPRQHSRQRVLGQQYRRPAILQHVGEAIGRILRIQRHIGGAGLQHRQQAHHHLQAALRADRDAVVRPDPQSAQVVCQAVGRGVEPGVVQACARMLDGRCSRRPLHLRFDQLVDAAVARIVDLGVVEFLQHLPALGLGEQRHAAERLRVVLDHRFEHRAPITKPVPDGCGVEQVAVVLALQPQLPVHLHRVDEQLEVLERTCVARELHVQAGERGVFVVERLVDVEHHADQRQPRRIASQFELAQQRAERVALVVQRIEQRRLRVVDGLRDRLRRVQVEQQRQGVDAMSDQVVVAVHRLSGGGDADHHLRLARQPRQQAGEAGQQRREQADPAARAHLADRRDQVGVEHVVLAR